MDPAEAEAAGAERRDVIESTRRGPAAEPVRQAWLHTLLGRKTPPTGVAAFTASRSALVNEALRQYLTQQETP